MRKFYKQDDEHEIIETRPRPYQSPIATDPQPSLEELFDMAAEGVARRRTADARTVTFRG